MSDGLLVTRAGPGDAANLVHVLTEAFLTNPLTAWVVPDEKERRTALTGFFGIFVEDCLEHGVAYTTANRSGGALWYDHRLSVGEPPRDYEQRLEQACGEYAPGFAAIDAAFDAHHPTAPHWHLAFLGVIPSQQGFGVASSLLTAHHDVMEQDAGWMSYLEATSPRAVDLYSWHGYEGGSVHTIGSHQVPDVAEGDDPSYVPVYRPMWSRQHPVLKPMWDGRT